MAKPRVIPGNAQVVTAVVFGPDAFSIQAASLGIMTNTFSPASAGIGAYGQKGFTGDRGYGVNRWAGAPKTFTPQDFRGVAAPSLDPLSKRLGAGAGVAGQPGLPNTGTGDLTSLAWMSMSQNQPGFGG